MNQTATVTERDPRKCEHTYEDGRLCNGWKANNKPYCAGHQGLGGLNAQAGAAASAQVRRDRAERRKLTLKDVYAAELEATAAPIVAKLKHIALNGNDSDALKAIEQWTSRVYGKPTDHVETTVTVPAALEELAGMSGEQRAALMRQVAEGKRLRLVADDPDEGPAETQVA